MNLKHVEQRLRVKQHELLFNLAAMGNETSSETLENVQEALRRLGDGNYGKCAKCGSPIEAARLKATPWSLYCLGDQHAIELTRSQTA
jgi:RNA polymerase-binding transcription factor DksA